MECVRCMNGTANPTVTISHSGLCNVCELYDRNFKRAAVAEELKFFKSLREEKVMVGLSGGKDSTAALYMTQKLGFRPTAFTFDTGYYPQHIFDRAKGVADKLGVAHEIIDIRRHVRPMDRMCYHLTADLYETTESAETFRRWYAENRSSYSAKSTDVMPFVRACQLCRRTVVRAYYEEAVSRGARAVVLGMNEWAGLSKNQFVAVRKLKPYHEWPEVCVVHLPFLLQHTIRETAAILKELGWEPPGGESLVESNANSCLFALATEEKARRLLGFHPDSTRLSREVTAGFISKEQGLAALGKRHAGPTNVRGVLAKAGIL